MVQWDTHRAKVALILKASITRFAVVPVVPMGLHMSIGRTVRMEHRIARLAGESRSPVVDGIHVLIRSILTAKCPCMSRIR